MLALLAVLGRAAELAMSIPGTWGAGLAHTLA